MFYSTFHLAVSFQRLTHATEEQIELRKAARELMDASDYLTEKVQRFTVQGDTKFLDEYFTEAFETNRREEAIEELLKGLPADAVVVSTTGMISREVYETRERLGQGHGRDFLTVGSMGHAIMIALGIAKAQPRRKVFCLDGDGASIMHLGNLAIAGQSGCANLVHVVLNNAAHDSVGGQPTVGGNISLADIAAACGYNRQGAPTFREIKVAKGARKDLGRPKEPPQTNKALYMQTLGVKA